MNVSEEQAITFMRFAITYTEGIVSLILSGVIKPTKEEAHHMLDDTAIVTIIITLLLLMFAIFLIGRYGWKLRGFNTCESAGIEQIKITENNVHIDGFDPSSFPNGFIGYYAKQDDEKLYVGFKFSLLFGWFETGNFSVDIPVEGEIKEVIMKTKNNEYSIWNAAEK